MALLDLWSNDPPGRENDVPGIDLAAVVSAQDVDPRPLLEPYVSLPIAFASIS